MSLHIREIAAPPEVRRKNDMKNPWRDGFAGPCLACGAPVKEGSGVMVHLHGGGVEIVTAVEAATMNPNADLGGYPIGPECYRKHKVKLKPYVDDFARVGFDYTYVEHDENGPVNPGAKS